MDYQMELALMEQEEQYRDYAQMREDAEEERADNLYNYLKEEGEIKWNY